MTKRGPRFLESPHPPPADRHQAMAQRHRPDRIQGRSSREEAVAAAEEARIMLGLSSTLVAHRSSRVPASCTIPTTRSSPTREFRGERKTPAATTQGCKTRTKAHRYEHHADRMGLGGEGLDLCAGARKKLDFFFFPVKTSSHLCLCMLYMGFCIPFSPSTANLARELNHPLAFRGLSNVAYDLAVRCECKSM